MTPKLDVNVITRPLVEARDEQAAEAVENDRKAAEIEEAAREAAAEILRKGAEDAQPFRDAAATARAHMKRFELLIAKEQHEARAAGATIANGKRPWTEDRRSDDGNSTIITGKRACNGCGELLGDVSDEEIEASIDGRPLPDVRSECPRCNDTADQPAVGQPPAPSPAGPTATDAEVAQP